MIFETERLEVRKLMTIDLDGFYELQSNPKVLQFATGEIKTFEENKTELASLIDKYNLPKNDFWIYAIIRKADLTFVGTIALVKDGSDDETGYRFIDKYWNLGYGFEICLGILNYCKSIKINKLVAYAADDNIASQKILERLNFKKVKHFIDKALQFPETKYEIEL